MDNKQEKMDALLTLEATWKPRLEALQQLTLAAELGSERHIVHVSPAIPVGVVVLQAIPPTDRKKGAD